MLARGSFTCTSTTSVLVVRNARNNVLKAPSSSDLSPDVHSIACDVASTPIIARSSGYSFRLATESMASRENREREGQVGGFSSMQEGRARLGRASRGTSRVHVQYRVRQYLQTGHIYISSRRIRCMHGYNIFITLTAPLGTTRTLPPSLYLCFPHQSL